MKRYSKLAILIILKAAVMIGGLAQAAEPPEEPILRIETGMHTAKINRIGVDAAERILVTASDEKTVKHCVSQLDQGKPWKQVLEEGNALVQIDSGRYELNQLVDSTIREKPTPGTYSKFTTNQDGSVSFTRFIKLYPARQQRSFEEARGLVINDYQAVLEQQWIARLKKQYPVTINENVFKQLLK